MLWCGDAECRQIGIPAWPGSSVPSCDIGFPYVLGVRCRLNTCALETKCSALLLALHFMTQSACALWQKLDLLWDLPAEDIPGCLSAQPAALFSSLMESQCQESTPWGFVWRHYARKPRMAKVSPGHSHSTAPPAPPLLAPAKGTRALTCPCARSQWQKWSARSTGGRWGSSTRRLSPLGSCFLMPSLTPSLTGGGCSSLSPCRPASSCSTTGNCPFVVPLTQKTRLLLLPEAWCWQGLGAPFCVYPSWCKEEVPRKKEREIGPLSNWDLVES